MAAWFWYLRRDSHSHEPRGPPVFETGMSAVPSRRHMIRLARVARARALAHAPSTLRVCCFTTAGYWSGYRVRTLMTLRPLHPERSASAVPPYPDDSGLRGGLRSPTSCMSRRRSGRLSYAEKWCRARESNPHLQSPKLCALCIKLPRRMEGRTGAAPALAA